MALLAIAHDWAGDRVSAVTVDHGLRPEAAAEAAAVAAFCAGRGIVHTILPLSGLAPGNVPAQARLARYGAISQWAAGRPVALGHTMDDQAETLLMRLARGSGVDGLAAMAEARSWLRTRWMRPLLSVRRVDLRTFLGSAGIAWAEDPTNLDPSYDRTRARSALKALAPLGIGVPGLADTATRLAQARTALDSAATTLSVRARRWGALGQAWLAPGAMAGAPSETVRRLLVDTLVRVSGRDYPPRQRAVAPLVAALRAGDAPAATLGGCLLQRDGADVLICREPAAVEGPAPVPPGGLNWDGRWLITGGTPGCRVMALGQALLPDDLAVPTGPAWRSVPAILRGDRLVAVPSLDYAANSSCVPAGRWTATLTLRHDSLGDLTGET